MQIKFLKHYLLLSLLLFPNFLKANEITILGNKRIESETIQSYFLAKDIKDYKDLNKILKEIYKTDLFSQIKISSKDGEIIVSVTENPIINKIEILGNKSLSEDVLKQEMSLVEKEVYTKSNLINDVNIISEIYKRSGRIKVKIIPKVKILENNRLDLILKVEENEKTKVSKIIFHGNYNVAKKKLYKAISTKERKWYRSSSSFYDPDRINFDKQTITRLYFNEGYANFNIVNSKVEYIDKINAFVINYLFEEGAIYHFGKISFENQFSNLKLSEIKKLVNFKKGDKFSLSEIENSVNDILDFLNNRGFAFADVDYDISKDLDNKITDIKFSIKKNKKIYIRTITINGNNRTEDKVIRREMKLFEGDSYSNSKLQRSKQRLTNLGFFANVQVKKKPVEGENLIDIEIEVAEQPTGELNFGFGYSTTEKFLGNVMIKERNLLGKAHSISISGQKSSISDSIDFSYTIPNFLNRDFSFGFDIFNLNSEYSASLSEINSQGASVKIFYEITEYLTQSLNYTYKIDDVFNVADTASNFIKEQEGETSYSAVSQSLYYDKRDNRLNPTKGYYLKGSTIFAGLNADTKFGKLEIGAVNYISFWKDRITLKTLAKGGIIEGYDEYDIKINHRFFLGGSSLKGFQSAGIGPRDNNGAALGGKRFYKGSVEFLFPLGLPQELGFKGSLFTDFGTVTGLDDKSVEILDKDSIRVSYGLGIAWESPLGPIRFDFAKPIQKETFDKTETFRINFGTRF